MDGDLYGGLELPKRTKREREEEKRTKPEESSSANDAAVKRLRAEKKPLDLAATVAKLEGYMLVDKKFSKASKLFCQLVSDQLTTESSELFLKTLAKVVDEKGATLTGKKEFQALIEAVDTKREVLLNVEVGEQRERGRKLDAWKFLAVTHAQLFTDETYQFNKAAKVVKLRFEQLVGGKEDQDNEELARRLHAELMPLLRTLYSKLNLAWATTIVEGVLALGTRHRLLFNEQDRVEVDSWTKGMQDRRSAPAIARSAGSDSRRNLVATGSKLSEAGARVPGRYNHPLFNKEL